MSDDRVWDPDPVQNAITKAAMAEVGKHTLKVVPRDPEQLEDWPDLDPWVVVNAATGTLCTFGGIPIYGGDTREEALEDARRLASKWDWKVEE